jgi:hypothetical protein
MAALNNLRPGTVIPPEICGIICQDIDLTKYDLLVLYAVSRAFREEAQRILYSSVLLNDRVQLKSFCISVLRQPYLVRGMRKLVLVMPSETYVDPDDFSRIVKMLRLSTDLRDLRVLCDSSSRPGMAIQSWILEGHTFKLTTFANSYFSYGRMEKFLASQPEIETLHIVRQCSAGLDGMLMPNLKNLRCSISATMSDLYSLPSAFHNKSNWERLRVTMSFSGHSWELERFSRWIKTEFGHTLKCSSISTHLLWHWQDWIEESMANVAKHLPGIKFLEITDYTTSVRYFKPFLVPLHRTLIKLIFVSYINFSYRQRYVQTLPPLTLPRCLRKLKFSYSAHQCCPQMVPPRCQLLAHGGLCRQKGDVCLLQRESWRLCQR